MADVNEYENWHTIPNIIDDELLPSEEYDAGRQFIELAKTLCVDSGGHYVGATVERLEELAAALMRVAESRREEE